MKPALVLGLALAANAFSAEQLDNELIIAPTDQFGNIKEYPRNIRFDEQADDELLVRPISTYVADDELRVAPRDENGNIKYPNPWIRYDDEGNEFFVVPTHRLGEMGHKSLSDNELTRYTSDVKELLERQMEYKGRFDDEADDELLAKSDPYEAQENHQYPSGVSTKLFVNRQKQAEALRRDNEADDELIVVAKDEFGKIKPSYIKYDKEGNELWFFSIPRYGNLNGRIPGIVADDELMISPFSRRRFENAEEGKTLEVNALAAHAKIVRHKKSHPGLDQFTKKHPEIALDDELLMRSTSAQFDDNEFIRAPKNKYPGNVMNDDEADDELAAPPQPQPRFIPPTCFAERRAEQLRYKGPAVPYVAADDEANDELFANQRPQENQQKPSGKKRGYFFEVHAQGMRNKAGENKRNGALPKRAGAQTRPQQPAERRQGPKPDQYAERHVHDACKRTERNKNYQNLTRPQPQPSSPEDVQPPEPRMFAEIRADVLRYNGPAVRYFAADDELYSGDHMSTKLFVDRQRHPEASQKDDEADNELVARKGNSKGDIFAERRAEALRGDDEADNELASYKPVVDHSEQIRYGKKPSNKPTASSGHGHPKGSLRPTLFVNKPRPAEAPKTNEADDEFLAISDPYGAQSNQPGPDGVSTKLFVDRQPQAVKNDDEGDDELAYLGDLLNEAHKKGLPSSGAFVRVFDDDEFLVERPALLNHQGVPSGAFVRVLDDNDDELFEVKGKVRPFLPFS